MTTLLISLVLFTFLLNTALEALNHRSSLKVPDPLVADLFDESKRSKAISYSEAKNRLSLISGVFNHKLPSRLMAGQVVLVHLVEVRILRG